MPSFNQWKDVKVQYKYKGNLVTEEMLLTIDLAGNQIVVLPTARVELASQPGKSCNYEKLRQDAIAKFQSLINPAITH
jgi:hypothetical protein